MLPGIHTIPMSAYLADPCPEPSLSSSCAHRLLTRSPLHAYAEHPRLGGAKPEEASVADIGSVAHDILLGGEGKVVALEFDDWRTKASKEARDAARAAGMTPILAHKLPPCIRMAEVAREFIARSEFAGIFDRGQPEQTMIWREGDVWCRARPDWLTEDLGVMLHYKSTEASARAEPFIRGIMQNMGYGFALRFYARGLSIIAQVNAQHLILVQEQAAPYACSLIGLTPAKAAIEDVRVRVATGIWRQCMETGVWPGYDTRVHWAEPTAWEMADAEGLT